MDIERMRELMDDIKQCKRQLHDSQYEVAIEITQRDEIMDAIESGLVKPCIPREILRHAQHSHGDLRRKFKA